MSVLSGPLPPFFLDTYSLPTSSLGCNALYMVISFLVLWSICLSSSLVHFRKGLKYLTRVKKGLEYLMRVKKGPEYLMRVIIIIIVTFYCNLRWPSFNDSKEILHKKLSAQSARVVKYTNCISA